MALIHCQIDSKILDLEMSVNVILPDGVETLPAELPTLYLLHGLSGNYSSWCRKTAIERYASAYKVAIVMPEVHRSFYTDMAVGYPYWTFLSEELPTMMEYYFPLSKKREDRFVAGLSMGGYGAMKWALGCPDKFSYAASLSGAVDLYYQYQITQNAPEMEAIRPEMENIFGDLDRFEGSPNDLFTLMKQAKKRSELPELFVLCGTEDFLYPSHLHFLEGLELQDIQAKVFEEPGAHEWDFWDRNIQRVLAWLPIEKQGE
ncbi:alpha/beta hydrolase family protein [Gottschalkiaceae bacterium SANA]|nr:alpha/beta hydrolase family protein [Gottschalkiaceae bacterium SANA]